MWTRNEINTDLSKLSISERETPLTDAMIEVGHDTTTMHVAIKTKLGWITWKEKEASLYRLVPLNLESLKEGLALFAAN